MDAYAEAKARLLTEYGAERWFLNADDSGSNTFAGKRKDKPFTVGRSKATHQIKSLNLTAKAPALRWLARRLPCRFLQSSWVNLTSITRRRLW